MLIEVKYIRDKEVYGKQKTMKKYFNMTEE